MNVTSGTYAKLTGTVRHIMKGVFWLHSNLHLKNSGIFVTRGRLCILAGSKINDNSMNTQQQKFQPAATQKRHGKDDSIGKTLRITKGEYKGHLAQIIENDGEKYKVELLSKMKKITIEKTKTVIIGDKEGSLETANQRRSEGMYDPSMAVPSTPFYTQDTPHYYASNATPHHYSGGETPGPGGGMTPGRTPNPYLEEETQFWSVENNVHTTINSNPTSSSSNTNTNDPWMENAQSPYAATPGSVQSPFHPSTPGSVHGGNETPGGGRSSGVSHKDWVSVR